MNTTSTTFTIGPATTSSQPIVIGLIEEASAWLRGKDTDQWARPWPDKRRRDARVRLGLARGETWLVWSGDVPAATMTICRTANFTVWGEMATAEAVYIHRLVVSRPYGGQDLGGVMIDWAVQRECAMRPLEWVRVDVWNSNAELHYYYERQGFIRCGTCADPSYPSGALFQKAADGALKSDTSRLAEQSQ